MFGSIVRRATLALLTLPIAAAHCVGGTIEGSVTLVERREQPARDLSELVVHGACYADVERLLRELGATSVETEAEAA